MNIDKFIDKHYNLIDCTADNKTRDKLKLVLEEYAQLYYNSKVKKLNIPVVGRSEQLKAEVFTLANKLALAGEGDAAVSMHRIHNRL
jgi:hypothetical protein